MSSRPSEAPARSHGEPPAPRPGVGAAHALLAVLVAATGAALLEADEGRALRPVTLAIVAFATLMALEARRPRLGRRVVLGTCALLLAAAVAAPPRHSLDVWSYAMYGRIVAHHRANPHVHPPSDFPRDPWLERVADRWRDTPSLYGPLFTVISASGMELAGESPLSARLFFQMLAALAVGAAILLLDRRTRDPAVLAWLGLNPLVVVSLVNGGHNDALAGLAILVAVLLVPRHAVLAGPLLGVAGLVKVTALLPAPAVAAWIWRRRGPRAGAALFGAASATAAGGYLLTGGTALAPLRRASRMATTGSIWNEPRRLLTDGLVAAGWAEPAANAYARQRAAMWASVAVLLLAAAFVAARLKESTPAPAVGAAVLAYLLAGNIVVPWYAWWSLPVLALRWRSGLAWATTTHAWVMLVAGQWLRTTGAGSPMAPEVIGALPAFTLLVIGVVLAGSAASLASPLARGGAGRLPPGVGPEQPDLSLQGKADRS